METACTAAQAARHRPTDDEGEGGGCGEGKRVRVTAARVSESVEEFIWLLWAALGSDRKNGWAKPESQGETERL